MPMSTRLQVATVPNPSPKWVMGCRRDDVGGAAGAPQKATDFAAEVDPTRGTTRTGLLIGFLPLRSRE
jgi:hypothetical protein